MGGVGGGVGGVGGGVGGVGGGVGGVGGVEYLRLDLLADGFIETMRAHVEGVG